MQCVPHAIHSSPFTLLRHKPRSLLPLFSLELLAGYAFCNDVRPVRLHSVLSVFQLSAVCSIFFADLSCETSRLLSASRACSDACLCYLRCVADMLLCFQWQEVCSSLFPPNCLVTNCFKTAAWLLTVVLRFSFWQR